MRIYASGDTQRGMADMVSNGKNFELASPIKSKFYVGSNQQPVKPSPQALENLRPQHISDALLLKPIEEGKEIAVLENTTEVVKDPKTHKDVQQLAYTVVVVDKDNAGYFLSRKVVFSRTDLLPHEQSIYDRQGRLVTFVRYENFSDYSGLLLPAIVAIQRPIDHSFLSINNHLPLNTIGRSDGRIYQFCAPGFILIHIQAFTRRKEPNVFIVACFH